MTTAAKRTDWLRLNRRGVGSRDRIVDAAIEVFTAQGYHGTTLAAIAERAGITDSGLLYHFGSKAELFAMVVQLREEPLQLAFSPPPATFDELVDAAVDAVRATLERPELVRFQAAVAGELMQPGHPFHAHAIDTQRLGTTLVARALGDFKRAGQLRADVDPRQLASEFIALHRGLRFEWATSPDRLDLAACFETAVRRLADAVRA